MANVKSKTKSKAGHERDIHGLLTSFWAELLPSICFQLYLAGIRPTLQMGILRSRERKPL